MIAKRRLATQLLTQTIPIEQRNPMTSPLLTVSDTTPVDFELFDAINPEYNLAGVLTLNAGDAGEIALNVLTYDGTQGAGLNLTRQGALDLAHYLINLVHPHAG